MFGPRQFYSKIVLFGTWYIHFVTKDYTVHHSIKYNILHT